MNARFSREFSCFEKKRCFGTKVELLHKKLAEEKKFDKPWQRPLTTLSDYLQLFM